MFKNNPPSKSQTSASSSQVASTQTIKAKRILKPKRTHPFTDDEIRAKAHQLWLQRGRGEGGEKEDWEKAIKELWKETSPLRPLWKIFQYLATTPIGIWLFGGFRGKTSWDLLQLLIVPAILALGAFYLQEQAKQREQQLADERARQETLNKYLDQMSTLLIEKGLRKAKPDSEVFILGQARTVSALRELDAKRQQLLTMFLIASDLYAPKGKVGILRGAYLAEIDLEGTFLAGADLQEAVFAKANLQKGNMHESNLQRAILSEANLKDSNFRYANLQDTFFKGANLQGANLEKTDLQRADFEEANLQGADFEEANLQGANLQNANLQRVDLKKTNLQGANLEKVNLKDAYMYRTDLSTTQNLTDTQLSKAILCRTKLPQHFKLDRDRDCGRIPYL